MRIDLHRHLGGSCRHKTIYNILKVQHPGQYIDQENLQSQMTFLIDDRRDFHNFLSKFKVLDLVDWTEEAITMVLEQVCWDISAEKLDYVELKFSVDKYAKSLGWSEADVVKFIYKVIQEYSENGIFMLD